MSTTTKRAHDAPPTRTRAGRPGTVLFLVCAAIFMLMLDTTVVSAALADIRADFDTSIDGLQWVIDGYAIPLAGLLLTFATVGDRYGRRRLFLVGMAVFTTASLALALAGTILQLDVLRAVQGVGATMLFATALPLLSVAFPDPAARMKAIGIYGAVMAGATVAGPVLGGALVTSFGWRSIFLVNVPIGIAILAVAARRLPESPRALGRRADWLGSVLLTGGLVAGVLALTRGNSLGWTSPAIVALAGAAVVLLVGFVAWQFRAPHPLFDVGMLRKPGFTGTAIVSVGHMATLMASANFLAIFLIGTFGCTPLQMGLRLLPISGAALVAAPVAAALAKRVPLRVSLPVTMGLVTVGMWWIGGLQPGDTWLHFVPGLVVGGLGLGAITALTQAASLTFASQENAGMASATFGTLRQVGMAVGVAGLGAVFSHVARDRAASGVDALPGGSLVPTDLRDQLADAIGAGAGHASLHDLPAQLHAAAPALARVADGASIDALNAMANLGAAVGAAATVGATAAFWLGGRRRSDRDRASA